MPKLTIHDRKGAKVGTYSVEAEDFAPSINKQLLHDAVVMYQANLRQGTHQTKTRGQVAGSTKKLYRQKGTGNARAGGKRSGTRRGGGHIMAIKPRDYSYRMPRKALQLATRMALATKVADDELVVIDELSFDSPKTSDMAGLIKALGCDGSSLLITTSGLDANVYKSARNLPRVAVSPASDLNALCLLKAKRLLITKAALDLLKEQAAKHKKPAKEEAPAS
ncbi:50S ribosomal protein L4 [Botrimarina colliarenosi]|uniref:Large ribosomal subunit protein uL4 n=1 Tax=Botrimarina colliarenosi TaxID=2528001 RepID=A0A5C6AAR2_9BACT|nr:50S ribosomal protein L4 [Botrimarina colliarenosi]TWT96649.1 50S ribosomal protein L4 [Botrimarina colliarenosi]